MPHPADVFLKPQAPDAFAKALVSLEQTHDSEVERLQCQIRLLQTSLMAAGRSCAPNSPAAHLYVAPVSKASVKSSATDASKQLLAECNHDSSKISATLAFSPIREATSEQDDSPSKAGSRMSCYDSRSIGNTYEVGECLAEESRQLSSTLVDAAQRKEGSKSTCTPTSRASTIQGRVMNIVRASYSAYSDMVHAKSSWDEDQQKKHRARMRAKSKTVSADTIDPMGRVALLVNSFYFETFFAIAILSNSVFLGITANVRAHHPPDAERLPFKVVEYSYTIVFFVELMVRLAGEGLWAYCDKDKCGWYLLDTFIVATSLLEVILDIVVSGDSSNSRFRVFRVIRVVRIIKVLRVARVVRFIRALRVLVLSIIHTLRSVLWAFVLLVAIIYMFSLIFLQFVTEYVHSRDSVPSSLLLFWGTLPRSMFTLYKSIASGISWHEVIEPLSEVNQRLVGLFILYISFTVFAVLNVITGVFCEAAIESTRQDNEMVVQQHLAEKDQFTSSLYKLFGVSGANDDEIVLSYDEFELRLADPRTKAHLAAIQLDVCDAWELFKLLDTDNSALIDVEEFVCGCLRLKGFAKAIDLAKLDYESKTRAKRLTKQIASIERKLGVISKQLSDAKICSEAKASYGSKPLSSF